MSFSNWHKQSERDTEEALAAKVQDDIELAAAKAQYREVAKQSAKLPKINMAIISISACTALCDEGQHDDTTEYRHLSDAADARDHDRLARGHAWRGARFPARQGLMSLLGVIWAILTLATTSSFWPMFPCSPWIYLSLYASLNVALTALGLMMIREQSHHNKD